MGDEAFHFLLFWKLHGVARDEDLVAEVAEGELDESIVLAAAKQDADRLLITRGHLVFFEVSDVGVGLTEVLVAEGVGLEFHEDVALEHAVVEDEIDEKGGATLTEVQIVESVTPQFLDR